ncbi:hypothetical protein HK103_003966 [Boothiomyces macroporosus]|uniref:RWD domain-containing protein n=1 Tax=Boothiomyces macroporosus TaxID=261099 RepID=A0AAD5UHA4_9FUNG|nr:hypothetical protein HK103_003966 [Boothiomyces macroporosus]
MDHQAEQEQELEALGFIYQENELVINDPKNFVINVHLDDPDLESIRQEDEEWLLSIEITFTPTYPEEIPEFVINSSYLLEEEIAELSSQLTQQCNDQLGIGMIFLMVSWLKEQSEITIKDRLERLEKERQELLEKQEEEERIKYIGTRVTKESFKEWQKAFLKEATELKKSGKELTLAMKDALAVEKLLETGGKKTGRQLFEENTALLKSDEQYMGEGEDVDVVIQEKIDEPEVEEALVFEDED